MRLFNIRKIYCLSLVFVGLLLGNCSQKKEEKKEKLEVKPEFKTELAMPDFSIASVDDSFNIASKNFNKEGLLLLKYFSPDCDHCQEEAEIYFSKRDSLKNIKTVWISGDWAKLDLVNEFKVKYKLEQLNLIAIGKENGNALLSHFKIEGVPFAAIYKENQLLKKYRGEIDFDELIKINDGDFDFSTTNSNVEDE